MYLAAGVAVATSLGAGVALACTPMDVDGAECLSVGSSRVVSIRGSNIREVSFTNRCDQDVLVSYEWAGDFQSRKLVPAGLDALIRCNAARCTGDIEWGAVCDGQTVPGNLVTVSVTGTPIPYEEIAAAEEEKAREKAAAEKSAKAAAAKKAKAEADKKAKAEAAAAAVTTVDLQKPIQEAAKPEADVVVAPLPPVLKPTKEELAAKIEAEAAAEADAEAVAAEGGKEPAPAPAEAETTVAKAAPVPAGADIPSQKIERRPVPDGAPPEGLDEKSLDELIIGNWNTTGRADLECETQSTTGTVSVKKRKAPFYYIGRAVVKTEIGVKDGCVLKIGMATKWTYESDISLVVRGDRVQITWHKTTGNNPGGVTTYTLMDGKLVAAGERREAGGAYEEVLTKRK